MTSNEQRSLDIKTFDRAKAEQAFMDYFVRNYPGPDTVIFDPKWHAPKLFSAAVAAIRSSPTTGHADSLEGVGDPSAWLFHSPTPQPSPQMRVTDDWFTQVASFFVKHEMLDERQEYDISDVMAALADNYEPKTASVCAVRAINWTAHPNSYPAPLWSGQTPFGFYNIEEVSASDSPAYEVRLHAHHLVAVKDSLEEAQSAAQADHDARIRAALSSATPEKQP